MAKKTQIGDLSIDHMEQAGVREASSGQLPRDEAGARAFLRRATFGKFAADSEDAAVDAVSASLGMGKIASESITTQEIAEEVDILSQDFEANGLSGIEVDDGVRLSREDHDQLVLHVRRLLDGCDATVRGQLHARMRRVNSAYQARTVDGNLCQDAADARATSPTSNHNDYLTFPIVNAKVTDAATIISNIIFPPTNLYTAISRVDKAPAARALTEEMNRYAATFGHFTQSYRAVLNLIRYNIAALKVEWSTIEGQQAQAREDGGGIQFVSGVVAQGTKLTSCDPFNIFWDQNVENLTQIAAQGEFVAHAQRLSLFELQQRIERGFYYGSTIFSAEGRHSTSVSSSYGGFYFVEPTWDVDWWEQNRFCGSRSGGEEHMRAGVDPGSFGAGVSADWSTILGVGFTGAGSSRNGRLSAYGAVEIVDVYVRLRGTDWGFGSQHNKTMVWHVVLLNGERIVRARPEGSAHGQLPINIAALSQDDTSFMREKSLAELLVPFQQHMQDIINKAQQTMKKGVQGGLTLYDAKRVKLDSNKSPVSGYVPVENLPEDKRIGDFVHQLNGMPDANASMSHVEGFARMLEMIVPTQQAQQVADLQRATEFQAAATVAASAKRHQTLAKLADDTLFAPCRRQQHMLLLSNAQLVEIIDEQGAPQQVSTADLVNAKLEFDISSGLLGMDRLILSSRVFQVLNLVVQGNMASQVDFLAMVDYWTTMVGDKTDFRAFRLKTQFDGLSPEQKDAAFQLLQQATAATGNNGQATVPADTGASL